MIWMLPASHSRSLSSRPCDTARSPAPAPPAATTDHGYPWAGAHGSAPAQWHHSQHTRATTTVTHLLSRRGARSSLKRSVCYWCASASWTWRRPSPQPRPPSSRRGSSAVLARPYKATTPQRWRRRTPRQRLPQPRNTRVRAIRPTVSVTVSARQYLVPTCYLLRRTLASGLTDVTAPLSLFIRTRPLDARPQCPISNLPRTPNSHT